MTLHDTHFHLDLVADPEGMVKKIESAKIYTIAVTNSPSVFFYTKKITEGCKYIKPAIGLHPELAFERKKEVGKVIDLLSETRYIGEIGLDNLNKTLPNYEIQKSVFSKIIQACAEKENKIITVHSRKASKDVINMIGDRFPGKVIMHWYSGGTKELEQALNYGFYFSVNIAMLQSSNGQKIISALPKSRILIETDGPFIQFNGQPSTPFDVEFIANQISNYRGISVTDIEENFKALFSE